MGPLGNDVHNARSLAELPHCRGLRGEALLKFELDGEGGASEEPSLEVLFQSEWGRIRSVSEGPDGTLYLLTSNRDGRGDPAEEDDRIIALRPAK